VAQIVLDVSAFLAYLNEEPGADVVADAIADGATISSVNLAEVLSRVGERGMDPTDLFNQMTASGLLGGAITIEPFTAPDAVEVARLRSKTRAAGLSLGDRACLALARRRNTTSLTADKAWAGLDLGLELRQIR